MEKQNNNEYGQTDPDFIDQNTLVDGNNIQSEDPYKKIVDTEHKTEFGETDPDYIDQITPVDHDNYAKDEDPYRYEEKFIEDLDIETDLENNSNIPSDKNQNPEKPLNKDGESKDAKNNNADENKE